MDRIPLIENKEVSKLLGFLVSWFLGFKVAEMHRFFHLIFFEDIDPILPSCHFVFSFLEDIDPACKIFKNAKTALRDFPVPAFPAFPKWRIYELWGFVQTFLKMSWDFFWIG